MSSATRIRAVTRTVARVGDDHEIGVEQEFAAPVADVWSACTDPSILARWFEPVSGDLVRGGRYTLTGSGTAGTILQCEPSDSLSVTWEFEGDVSHVSLRIAPVGEGRAVLRLTHRISESEHWRTFGPAAAGAGWDESLLALGLFLAGDPRCAPDQMAEFATTAEGADFTRAVTRAWAHAHKDGGADPEAADAQAAATAAFYLGED